jgi:uncharacterized protein YciI
MYIVVWNTHAAGTEETRRDVSEAMKAYIHNHSSVTLHQGGATLGDDAETVVGGVMILEAPSLDVARAFVADSPFGKAGVLAESQVRPVNWLTGRPAE